ncbi:hypothetical protein AU467_02575 [Mesorhizobium loti]|uniref:Zorya protein ZorC EH domain-containing protein n=1 Tax=Rhizobium loti TaxID=381 RepID=A0A101KUP5_RHILI|nr:hypothetical protein AU467_02575 [Mesorhizobium loti]
MSAHLKEAIAELVIRHGVPARPSTPAQIEITAGKLRETDRDAPRTKDYDAISEQLALTLSKGDRITGRQARDGAWCLWQTRFAIAADPATLKPFLGQLRELKHKGASRALALSYLISFHEDRPGLSAVAATLRDLAAVAGKPFDTLEEKFRIFDINDGPRLIGEAALAQRKSPRIVLAEQGLQMELVLGGGFVEPCARRVLERVAEDKRLPSLERIDFVKLISVNGETKRLNFPGHKDLVANALLLPYANQRPDEVIRDRTLDLLISLEGVGDPRTRSGNWASMPRSRDIAVSWLTEQALRQFLDVVEEVNPNEYWHYRRTFWEAMHDGDAISAAWVVMDREGAREARRRFGKNTGFAQFTSGAVQAGHAVLLLRIGEGVCAEWSFNGKCRFWQDAQRQGAPRLYDDGYDAEFLRTGTRYPPMLEITHYPHTGPNAWQHLAARQIQGMTGMRFSPKEYMP